MTIPPSLVLRSEFRPLAQEPTQPQGQEPAPFVSREQGGGETEATTEQNQQTQPKDQGDPMAGCYGQLPLILGVIAIFYFLAIRPQQKQEKARKEMLSKVQTGDQVVTTGGIHGKISSVTERTVVLTVARDVKMTFDRGHIARVLRDEEEETPEKKS